MIERDSCSVKKLPAAKIEEYERVQDRISAIANKYRIAILLQLDEHGELCACDLEPVLKLSQSSVTLHLQKLYRAGFLKKTEKGKYTYYDIKDEGRAILTLLKTLNDRKRIERAMT